MRPVRLVDDRVHGFDGVQQGSAREQLRRGRGDDVVCPDAVRRD